MATEIDGRRAAPVGWGYGRNWGPLTVWGGRGVRPHSFGADADALVMARPVWFKAAVWLELVVQLPFYVAAIYAFVHRCVCIRTPGLCTRE